MSDTQFQLEHSPPGVPDGEIGEEEVSERTASLWADAWRQLRSKPIFWVSISIITVFTVMAIAPQIFVAPSPATHDPFDCSLRDAEGEFQDRLPPSSEHWFGTDVQGCDYYVRVIYGARVSMVVGVAVTAIGALIGLVLGGIAGFWGGWTDNVISRITDVFFAFPFIVGAILLLSVIQGEGGRTLGDVVLVIGLFSWPTISRIFRGSVIQARGQEYVEAARALGASNRRILVRHVLPNAIAPAIVYATITLGVIISVEATLSFLGVGLQLPAISWGLMINTAQTRIAQSPHLLFFPGAALFLIIFAFILLGDAVRDALDPRTR